MTYVSGRTDEPLAAYFLHAGLIAFPIACFTLTVITDLAYWQTLNLLWLHFSEWLLFAGIVFGVIAAVARLIDLIVRKVRPSWVAVGAGVLVLLLATLNSFIHTADGITAVVPYGILVSVLTVVAMVVTGWLARTEVRHV
jgi:uncharacterized membrane protein